MGKSKGINLSHREVLTNHVNLINTTLQYEDPLWYDQPIKEHISFRCQNGYLFTRRVKPTTTVLECECITCNTDKFEYHPDYNSVSANDVLYPKLTNLVCPTGRVYTSIREGRLTIPCACKNCLSDFTNYDNIEILLAPVIDRIAKHNRQITVQKLGYLLDVKGLIPLYWSCKRTNHNVDHIIPFSFFDMTKQTDIQVCWSPHNLRRMNVDKNKAKGNVVTSDDLIKIRESDFLLNFIKRNLNKYVFRNLYDQIEAIA